MAASRPTSFEQLFKNAAPIEVPRYLSQTAYVSQDDFEKLFSGFPLYPYAATLVNSFQQAFNENNVEAWFELACGKMANDLFKEDGSLQPEVYALLNQQDLLKKVYNAQNIAGSAARATQTVNAWIAKAYLKALFIQPALKTLASDSKNDVIKHQINVLLGDIDEIYATNIKNMKSNYDSNSDYLKDSAKSKSTASSSSSSDSESSSPSMKDEELPAVLQYLLFEPTPAFFQTIDFANPSAEYKNEVYQAYSNDSSLLTPSASHKQDPLLYDIKRTHWVNGKRYQNEDLSILEKDVKSEFEGHFDISRKFYTQDVSAPPVQQLQSRADHGKNQFKCKRMSAVTSTKNGDMVRTIVTDIKFIKIDDNGDALPPISIPGYIVFDCALELKRDNDPHFKPTGYKPVREAASNKLLFDLLTQSGAVEDLPQALINDAKNVEDNNWDEIAALILANNEPKPVVAKELTLEEQIDAIETMIATSTDAKAIRSRIISTFNEAKDLIDTLESPNDTMVQVRRLIVLVQSQTSRAKENEVSDYRDEVDHRRQEGKSYSANGTQDLTSDYFNVDQNEINNIDAKYRFTQLADEIVSMPKFKALQRAIAEQKPTGITKPKKIVAHSMSNSTSDDSVDSLLNNSILDASNPPRLPSIDDDVLKNDGVFIKTSKPFIKENPNLSAFLIGGAVILGLTAIAIALCIFVPPVGAAFAAVGLALGAATGLTLTTTTAAVVGAVFIGAFTTAALAISTGISALVTKLKGKNHSAAPQAHFNRRGSFGDISDRLENTSAEISQEVTPKIDLSSDSASKSTRSRSSSSSFYASKSRSSSESSEDIKESKVTDAPKKKK